MANVTTCGQSRTMYGAAAIRFFDDDVALFVLLRAGSAMRRDLLEPEPSIWCIVCCTFPPVPPSHPLGWGPPIGSAMRATYVHTKYKTSLP